MTSNKDRDILRRLAGKWREIAGSKANLEKKKNIIDRNSLKAGKPGIFFFTDGTLAWEEIMPSSTLECADPACRDWEFAMKAKIYCIETVKDDTAIGPYIGMGWSLNIDYYGVEVKHTTGKGHGGSFVWDHPVKDIEKDFSKLTPLKFSVDRKATADRLEFANSIFGDLLPVKVRILGTGLTGLTETAIKLIGLENMMMYMYDKPEALHRLMKFLADENSRLFDWMEKEKLLTLNNGHEWVGSGGVAFTDDLPHKGFKEDDAVSAKDMWVLGESQETVGVSPEMFDEFVFKYQYPYLSRFGLVAYGCCEPLHTRIDVIKRLPNLRRIAVSPWADQEIMAQKCGNKMVYVRRPNPTLVCASFNEADIRNDIKSTLKIAGKLPLEIQMKDIHTLQSDPSRPARWVQIAREEVDKYMEGK